MLQDNLYVGCKVKIVKCSAKWYWYASSIGEVLTVTEIRNLYEDVIVAGKNCTGNCIDFEDLEFVS